MRVTVIPPVTRLLAPLEGFEERVDLGVREKGFLEKAKTGPIDTPFNTRSPQEPLFGSSGSTKSVGARMQSAAWWA